MYKKYLFYFILLILITGCNEKDTKKEKIIEKKESPISIEKKEKVEKKDNLKKIVKKPTITVKEKKDNFKTILVPIVTEVYMQLQEQYKDLKRDLQTDPKKQYIQNLKVKYGVKTDQELLKAIKPHPISVALSQAAAESAWLTSRFTKSANNIFGVWSFSKKEPRIAATGLRGDKTIYLKKYRTLKESVEDYYLTIAKSWAYKEFRNIRSTTNDPYMLIPYLDAYSEKKELYTVMLIKVLTYNHFDKYDIK